MLSRVRRGEKEEEEGSEGWNERMTGIAFCITPKSLVNVKENG